MSPTTAVGVSGLVALLVAGLTRPIADPDTWWHLWSGEWMLDNAAILRTDLLSFTSYGDPYLPHSWLAEVLLALPVLAWDARGLLLVRAGLLLGTYGLLAVAIHRLVPQGRAIVGWALVILSAFAGAASWSVRPYLFSYLLLVVTMLLLEQEGATRWLLVPLFALWANLHGLWVLGLVLVGIKIMTRSVETRRVAWGWVLIAVTSAVATLVNPFGWELHSQLVELTSTMKRVGVLEWRATDFTMPTHWAWALLATASVGLVGRGHRIARSYDWVIVATAVVLGVVAVRNLPPSAIMLALVAARYVPRPKGVLDAGKASLFPAVVLALSIIVLTALVAVRFPRSGEVSQVAGDNLPVRLASQLEPGRVLTVDGWGGIMSYQRWPEVLVAYDTRIDFHGEAAFQHYWRMVLVEESPQPWLQGNCVEQVLGLDTWPLVSQLRDIEGWLQVASEPLPDGRRAVLLRTDMKC